MSSSLRTPVNAGHPGTAAGRRVQVLRGVTPQSADLGTVRASVARHLVVDPLLVEEATEDGYRGGYDAGFTAALEDASDAIESRERSRAEQLTSTLRRLAAAADQLAPRHREFIEDIEQRVMEIAFAIAEELVGRELRSTDDRGRDALQRALRLAPDHADVTARLHPDDIASVGDVAQLGFGATLTIKTDASLDPGDCVVDFGSTRIDARIASAIRRVREVIGQ